MAVKRPRREQYESDVEFCLASMRYLDAKHPGRAGQRQRIAKWQKWSRPLTDEEVAGRLVALWRRHKHWTDADRRAWVALAEIDRERDSTTPPTPRERQDLMTDRNEKPSAVSERQARILRGASARPETKAPLAEVEELESLLGIRRTAKQEARFAELVAKSHDGTLSDRAPAPRKTRESVAGVGDRNGEGRGRGPALSATDMQVREILGGA